MKRMPAGYGQPPRRVLTITEFRGVDLQNAADNTAFGRSPSAPNMIRDVPGKVRKRMGFYKAGHFDGRINGVFFLHLREKRVEVCHAGTRLFADGCPVYEGMNDARSCAFSMGGALFVLDGKRYVRFDGETAQDAAGCAYIPTLILSRRPSGGGTPHEGMNLLGKRWTESFLSDGESVYYQLSYDGLDDGFVRVEVMTQKDRWTTLTRDVDYTLNAALGAVIFTEGRTPPLSPQDGADNLRVTVQKERPDGGARIEHCRFAVLYGVGGSADRVFVSGNPAYANRDWHSEMNNPLYFPQNNYSVLGGESAVSGYSVIGDKLAAHKLKDADGRNILIRSGMMQQERAVFPVTDALQSEGMTAWHSAATLKTEPLFLSHGGVCAVTPADAGGDRYAQNRSYFINDALRREDHSEAVAAVFGDFYLLAAGGKIYVLDSLMKTYEAGAPYATHQYECYVLTGIDARVLYRDGGALRFGTADGEVMEFYSDARDPASYRDNGAPIAAHWDTPMLFGESFYTRKNFKYLALKLMAAPNTGVSVQSCVNGLWQPLFSEFARTRFWTFSALSFGRLTFCTDGTPKAFGRRISLPKTDRAQFRLSNDRAGEPFGLYQLSLEYLPGGRIR